MIRSLFGSDRTALLPYLTAGLPSPEVSPDLFAAMADAGADAFEIGIPYSDPLMDGPVIQAACQVALEHGYTVADDLSLCADVAAASDVPALVMTYYNLVWRYGGAGSLEPFAQAAADAGLAGTVLPDLPADEGAPWCAAAAARRLATVFLAAPTSTDERLRAVAEASTGFVYATSTLGVTGERTSLAATAAPLVKRLRACTDRPVCVGIGVSTPDQAAEVASFADGVIVGSAAVRAAGDGGPQAVHDLVAGLAEGCRRA